MHLGYLLAVGMLVENISDNNCQRCVIINIASVMADDASADLIAYAARCRSRNDNSQAFANKRIRVINVPPGYIHTPMTDTNKNNC